VVASKGSLSTPRRPGAPMRCRVRRGAPEGSWLWSGLAESRWQALMSAESAIPSAGTEIRLLGTTDPGRSATNSVKVEATAIRTASIQRTTEGPLDRRLAVPVPAEQRVRSLFDHPCHDGARLLADERVVERYVRVWVRNEEDVGMEVDEAVDHVGIDLACQARIVKHGSDAEEVRFRDGKHGRPLRLTKGDGEEAPMNLVVDARK
jgi:hypothetical protein